MYISIFNVMNNVEDAWRYLIAVHAKKKEIPIGNVIRGRIVMCGTYQNHEDYVWVYRHCKTAIGYEYILENVPLPTILRELNEGSYHGNYWIESPSHIVTIEIWDKGKYNF